MEKVSIIVPVYNGAKVLKRCVDSILKQDYENIEVLLVNDGSSDASQDIAESYAAKDPRVHAVYKENGGVSSARNRGIVESTGTYVQFVDVDDWLPMEATKLLVREIETTHADLAIGDFYRVVNGNLSQKGSIDKAGIMDRRKYADAMMRSPADLYYGVLWNKLYRKEIISKHSIRMDEKVSYSEDMLFNLEYLLHAEQIAVLKAPVYYYVLTKGSLLEKNMGLGNAIKMKKSVIGYYNQFYRKVFDERSYQDRRLVIYGYLLSFSTDFLSVPFAPGTKKLGEEKEADLQLSEKTEESMMFGNYLGLSLITHYMNTMAVRHAFELNDVRILYFLWKMEAPCSVSELCAFTGIGQTQATMSVTRLLAAGAISRAGKEESKKKERFQITSDEIKNEMALMEQDYEQVCFQGMNADEKETCLQMIKKVNANVRKHIAASD